MEPLADPGGTTGTCPPPPQQDQFLSFLHIFSPKSVRISGWCPPPTGRRPPPPPTGNPGSATGDTWNIVLVHLLCKVFMLFACLGHNTGWLLASVYLWNVYISLANGNPVYVNVPYTIVNLLMFTCLCHFLLSALKQQSNSLGVHMLPFCTSVQCLELREFQNILTIFQLS